METKSSNRSFGVVFFIFFLLIAIWPMFKGGEIRIWSILLSLFFLTFGILNSKVLTPLNYFWIKFGDLLGRVIAPVVMGFIFFSCNPNRFIHENSRKRYSEIEFIKWKIVLDQKKKYPNNEKTILNA